MLNEGEVVVRRAARREPGQSLGQPSFVFSSSDWSTSESRQAFQRGWERGIGGGGGVGIEGAGGGEASRRGRKRKLRARVGAGMDLSVDRGGVSGGVRIA